MPTYILGLSAYYHDSAAALLKDGDIVAAAEEERFTRVKHERRFPEQAARYCLEEAKILAKDLAAVAYYDKPILMLDRLLETYLAFAPRGFSNFRRALPLWAKEKIFLPRRIGGFLGKEFAGKMLFFPHHLSHAASAFYPSPFERAAILTVDGVGEWSTATLGLGSKDGVRLIKEIRFPHSLGLLYSAFTYYLGFTVNSAEYKVMGLAPYGAPRYYDTIMSRLIEVRDDGSFWMDMRYFNYCQGLTMTSPAFDRLFGGPRRKPESALEPRHLDLAASVQKVCEDIMLKMAKNARQETGADNLCLAGGVALNCVANGLIAREKIFKRIFVQPAAGDAGGALGAALLAHHQYLGNPRTPRRPDSMKGALLGPAFSPEEIRRALKERGVSYEEMAEDKLLDELCALLEKGSVIGLFRGRMEFGPRALGARSIIADPRNPAMQKRLNLKIKFRESFRPFAPAILAEDATDYFDIKEESPYMLLTAPIRERRRLTPPAGDAAAGLAQLNIPRSVLPAVTHVDYSARIQTVSREANPFFHGLLSRFKARTGCPALVNTSFNVRGEPIVRAPQEALECFLATGMDALAMENFLVKKTGQEPAPNPSARRPRDDWNPNEKKTRNFALSLLGGALLASVVLFLRGRPQWRWVAAGGLLCGAAAYFWRTAGVWLYRAVNGLARALAALLTGAILAVAYYAFVSPFALLLRCWRKDRLDLRPGRAESFWAAMPKADEKDKINDERLY